MLTFKKWLEEKRLNEIFIYTSDYTEISKNEFIKYEKKIALHLDSDALVKG